MYKLGKKEQIELSMLPEEYQETAEVIGVEAFLKLCYHYGGSNLYIPKQDRVTRHIRDSKIKKEFKGGNYKELARKFGLSESHIRKIVGNKRYSLQQTTIWDFVEEKVNK